MGRLDVGKHPEFGGIGFRGRVAGIPVAASGECVASWQVSSQGWWRGEGHSDAQYFTDFTNFTNRSCSAVTKAASPVSL